MLLVAKQWSYHVMPFEIAPANGTLFKDATCFTHVVEVFYSFCLSSFFPILNDLFVLGSVQAAQDLWNGQRN